LRAGRRLALWAALSVAPAAAAPAPQGAAAPTFCAEWILQSREGYERLTLFADRSLVWKTNRGGTEQLRRQKLPPDEAKFYCEYFRGAEAWSAQADLRSGLTGDLGRESVVTLAREDGSRREIRFDELSALTPEAAALRSSLEGLKGIFLGPLAPASRFTPETLPPGSILRRFDGALFRVVRLNPEKGVVELEGVREPFTEFRKLDELRFLFAPPEAR
jgi:hypothetical protein